MHKLLTLTALAGLISAPAYAGNLSKFQEDMVLPQGQTIAIEIGFSELMQERAVGLPERMSDRNGARGLRDGFGGNGFYGERELDILADDLAEELTDDLTRAGYSLAEDGTYTLRVTIVDAKPNRPTIKQLSVQPSLSMRSIGTGGAELQAELIGPSGDIVGTSSYSWYENNIEFVMGVGTWTDARRTFSRFSKKTSKSISS